MVGVAAREQDALVVPTLQGADVGGTVAQGEAAAAALGAVGL